MTTVKAQFDGKVFIPQEPVGLPAGCTLEISYSPPPTPLGPQSTLARLAEIAKDYPDDPKTPTDLAEQHDHYLYGTSKRP